jgi:hypothetical protein
LKKSSSLRKRIHYAVHRWCLRFFTLIQCLQRPAR